jgi:hypothetical protein
MKTKLILLLSLFTINLFAGDLLTSPVYVIYNSDGDPVKVYQKAEDYIHFINKNKQYSEQDARLYYQEDTTTWQPTSAMLADELQNPDPLTDKFLAKKTIYLVMQSNFYLVDRAYLNLDDGQKYIDNFKLKYIEVPYYYRNKQSYDELYRIKKNRLNKR